MNFSIHFISERGSYIRMSISENWKWWRLKVIVLIVIVSSTLFSSAQRGYSATFQRITQTCYSHDNNAVGTHYDGVWLQYGNDPYNTQYEYCTVGFPLDAVGDQQVWWTGYSCQDIGAVCGLDPNQGMSCYFDAYTLFSGQKCIYTYTIDCSGVTTLFESSCTDILLGYYSGGCTTSTESVSCGAQDTAIWITDIKSITPPLCTTLSDPYTCVNPSFVALSTRTGDSITVTGLSTYQDSTDISEQITWTCVSNPNAQTDGGVCNPSTGTGSTFTFIPNPPATTTGRTVPLSYLITAQITTNSGTYQDTRVITQDSLDELRQEYEDFPAVDSKERVNFDRDDPAYAGLLGPAAEPNRFNGWHILRSLNRHAKDTVNNYITLNITSGYRTPIGNNSLRPQSAANSNHQYGRALDFVQQRSPDNYDAYRAAFNAGAREDTYLQGSNGIRYFWYTTPPPPNSLPIGVTYIQGHAAWVN